MADTDSPVESKVREVLHDISFFERYDLPVSPPFTPPMKGQAKMADSKAPFTPMNPALDKMFPKSPPESPRNTLKRKFSNNTQSALAGILTPPSTPPTNMMHSTLARTMTGSDAKKFDFTMSQTSRRSTLTRRPTIITADFGDMSPSRRYSRVSRSSSYSSAAGTPCSSKDALARCKEYEALSTESQYPITLPSPSYFARGSTPPPNTPMYPIAGLVHYDGESKQAGAQGQSYPGRSNLGTSSALGFGYPAQYPTLPGPEDFKFQERGIEDLEKQRVRGYDDEDGERALKDPGHPDHKRHCKRKALLCCILIAMILALIPIIIVIVVVLRKHRKLHSRCASVPGFYMNGQWQDGYQKC